MADKKIVWNPDQVGQDTPKPIKLFYRVLMFVSFMWAVALQPRFPNIPATTIALIDSILIIANQGIYFFCQCFGYKCPEKINGGDVDGAV